MTYEVEIKIPKHKWEVMYHTFENIENLWKEIYWIMGHDDSLEEKIPLDLIEEIKVNKVNGGAREKNPRGRENAVVDL